MGTVVFTELCNLSSNRHFPLLLLSLPAAEGHDLLSHKSHYSGWNAQTPRYYVFF